MLISGWMVAEISQDIKVAFYWLMNALCQASRIVFLLESIRDLRWHIRIQFHIDHNWAIITAGTSFRHGRGCSGGTVRMAAAPQLVWRKKEWAASILQAEAPAMLLAVEIAKEQGWSRVMLLSAWQVLYDAINGLTDPPWEASLVIDGTLMSNIALCLLWSRLDPRGT